jgi:hypothetical protein
LKWQLGNVGPANGYGTRGTKRGKEVIDMTIEEMEAEIRRLTSSSGRGGGGAWD